MERCVITGFGIVTYLGESLDTLWNTLCEKKGAFDPACGNHPVISGDRLNLPSFTAIPRKKRLYFDKQVVFTFLSAMKAIENAQIKEWLKNPDIKEKTGVVVGNKFAQVEFGIQQVVSMNETKSLNISPFTGIGYYFGGPAGEIASEFKTKGQNDVLVTGSSAGFDCVTTGYDSIRYGRNHVVLAGAGENILSGICDNILKHKLSSGQYLPYHKNRQGCFIASGGGIAVLESLSMAKERKAAIYAEIEAHHSLTAHSCLFEYNQDLTRYTEKAIRLCLEKSGITPQDIDMVIPNADGSKDGDHYELQAIKNVFQGQKNLIYTPKPNVGHTLSVSGIIDLFTAAMSLKHRTLPPLLYPIDCDEENTNSMFISEKMDKNIKRVLMLQRNIVGGRVGAMIVKEYSCEDH